MAPVGTIQVTGGSFMDMEGNPLANGTLVVELGHDASVVSIPNLIGSGLRRTISLNSSGNIPSSPAVYLYSNSAVSPFGTFYIVRGYDSTGTEAFGPQYWSLPSSPSPYNVANQVPLFPPGGGLSSGGSLTLQVNGTNSAVQSLLNLTDSSTVTWTDNGGGSVSAAAASNPPVVQTDFRLWKPSVTVSPTSQLAGVGCVAVNYQSFSPLQVIGATSTQPPLLQIGGGGGNYVAWIFDGNTSTPIYPATYGIVKTLKMQVLLDVVQSTGTWRNWYGWSSVVGSSLRTTNPSSTYTIAFRYILGTDTHWVAYCSNGSSSTAVDTGISVDTALHTFEIDISTTATFRIDGVQVAQISTTLPGSSNGCWPVTQEDWSGGLYNLFVGQVYWELNSGWGVA